MAGRISLWWRWLSVLSCTVPGTIPKSRSSTSPHSSLLLSVHCSYGTDRPDPCLRSPFFRARGRPVGRRSAFVLSPGCAPGPVHRLVGPAGAVSPRTAARGRYHILDGDSLHFCSPVLPLRPVCPVAGISRRRTLSPQMLLCVALARGARAWCRGSTGKQRRRGPESRETDGLP